MANSDESSSQSFLPHDPGAEKAVLGAVILNNGVFPEVVSILQPEDFFSPANTEIYKMMLVLDERSSPIDEVALSTLLRDHQLLDKVGGGDYIYQLIQSTPVVENVLSYAQAVREKGQLRKLIVTAQDIAEKGQETPEGFDTKLALAIERLHELGQNPVSTTFHPIKDVFLEVIEKLEKISKTPEHTQGLPTGFTQFDEITHGLHQGDLIIIAARPAMGKTAFALSLATHASLQSQLPVIFFSLEMPKEQIAMRILCSNALVNNHLLKSGNLEDEHWHRLSEETSHLLDMPLWIDDTSDISTTHIRSVLRRIQQEQEYEKMGTIVVDYLQLMHTSGRSFSREQEIAHISRNLKQIAKEFDIPVIALSQLNRDLERRADKHPVMSDLRESGALEQDADLVLFIYRDEVYNKESSKKGIAEIIIAKHRNGSTGDFELMFQGEYTKFANLPSSSI